MRTQRLPGWLSVLFVGGAFGALLWLERRWPLRHSVESKLRREARNLAMAGLGAAAVQIAETPVTGPLSALVERRRWGILKRLTLPTWLEVLLAVTLLDYTLYIWHVLVHRVPVLWRFHKVHHVDLDLDASTALRFHFGELIISVPYRCAQVVLIGASPLALSVWQTLLLTEVLFHHSNVELPIECERWLNRLVVTPRMHGIHHSIVEEEVNSNWSSGLTIWDWLHGTLRLNVPQQQITIGAAGHHDPAQVTLPKIIVMPFQDQGTEVQPLAQDGKPMRSGQPVPTDYLLR